MVKRKGLKNSILLLILMVLGIPVMIFCAFMIVNTGNFVRNEVEARNSAYLKIIRTRIEEYLLDVQNDLHLLKELLTINETEDNQFHTRVMENLLTHQSIIHKIQITDENGFIQNIHPYDDEFIGVDVSGQPYFQETMRKNDIHWSKTFFSPQLNTPIINLNIPYKQGILSIFLLLDNIKKAAEILELSENSFFAIVDQAGFYISHTDEKQVQERSNDTLFHTLKKEYTSSIYTRNAVYKNEAYIVYLSMLPESGWGIMIYENQGELFQPMYDYLLLAVITAVTIIIAAFIISQIYSVKFIGIVDNFIMKTRRISQGNYDSHIEETEYYELSILAEQFNGMIKAVNLREHELRESNDKINALRNYLKNIIDSMPSMLVGVDPDGFITQWNLQAENNTGIRENEALGNKVEKMLPLFKKQLQKIKDSVAKRKVEQIQKITHTVEGDIKYSNMTVYPLIANGIQGAVVKIDDITDQIHLEEMMVQTEKMMSVGGLAAGMAHEINNPLAAIMQNSQNIQRRLFSKLPGNLEAARECGIDFEAVIEYMNKRHISSFIESVRDAGKRASKIVENMLQFSYKGINSKTSVDIHDMINKTLDIASKDYDLKKKYDFKNVEIIKEFSRELVTVPCVPVQIEQVLLNLFKNASQAMWEHNSRDKKPIIRIRTNKIGGYARISVIDNGPGIPQAHLSRIFEPFFTTKKVGYGTGLGLSVSYFIIVDKHGGSIFADSIEGEGSTFTIELPLVM